MTLEMAGYRRVHFVGIGGIGMSALARLLLAQGHSVSGSDRSAGEQTVALRELGIPVAIGHREENVAGADLVVVTSAASADNPEVAWARQHNVPVIKRSQLLGAVMNPQRGVAVAGTHGKTTTSALISHILLQGGLDPTVLIGGISATLGSNARVGGELVVVEADEYDASFLQLEPSIAVITNVEADHLDFYGTEAAVHEAFRAFTRQVRDLLVVCADDPGALSAVEATDAAVVTYGINAGEWRAEDIRETADAVHYVAQHGGVRTDVRTTLAGLHNVRNSLAAIAVGAAVGVSPADAASALAEFRGVARRTEVIGEARGVLVVDDYAHHPSEIRTVLRALRTRHHRPIRVLFQPHTYSRTQNHLHEFAESFGDADSVYLLDIYAARERDTLGVSSRTLADAARDKHAGVVYAGGFDQALDRLVSEVAPGDVVITMGAGDVNQLAPRILERIAGR